LDVTRELDQIRAARRELEVDVATKIGEWLISNQSTQIRDRVLMMAEKALSLGITSPGQFSKFFTADNTRHLSMWSRCNVMPTGVGLALIHRYVGREPASLRWLNVCADVVRLFGELAECKWVNCGAEDANWNSTMAIKNDRNKKYRPHPVYAKSKDGDVTFGNRDRGCKATPTEVRAPFVPIPRSCVPWRGVELFEFGNDSIIENIDWTYGLQIEGGDVSGTTSDTIAALEWTDREAGSAVDEVVNLLAIATMVPQGHHTIVECAWPLTRAGKMNYHIGFYNTLVSDAHDLSETLRLFDDDRRNRHVLVYKGEDRVLAGEAVRDAQESGVNRVRDPRLSYRNLASVRRAYSFCAGGRPRTESLLNFIKIHAPNLLHVWS